MSEEINQFIDGSQDKEYFTITPNIIINGYSATESGVYTYVKRKAGEDGQFYERVKVSAKKLKLHPQTFRKIRDKFVKDGRLKYIGEKKETENQQGGIQTIKVFKVTDIWKENIKIYKGGENKTTHKPKGGENKTTKGGENKTPNNIPIEEEPINENLKKLNGLKAELKEKMFVPGTGYV